MPLKHCTKDKSIRMKFIFRARRSSCTCEHLAEAACGACTEHRMHFGLSAQNARESQGT